MTTDMSTPEIMAAADLTWRFVGPAQENLTYHPERNALAAWAELYTEDGALLLAMVRQDGMTGSWWIPERSELLTGAALRQVPYAETIEQLDIRVVLDLETEDARRAS